MEYVYEYGIQLCVFSYDLLLGAHDIVYGSSVLMYVAVVH